MPPTPPLPTRAVIADAGPSASASYAPANPPTAGPSVSSKKSSPSSCQHRLTFLNGISALFTDLQAYRPTPAVRRKTQPNTSLTFSISSEDPDGLRVAYDAQPDTVPTNFNGLRHVTSRERNKRWTQSTTGGASSYYPPSAYSSSDQLTTDDSTEPGTPTTVSNFPQLDALVEEVHLQDDDDDDIRYLYPHHNNVDPNDVFLSPQTPRREQLLSPPSP